MPLSLGHIQKKESAYSSEAGSFESPVPVTTTRTHNTKYICLPLGDSSPLCSIYTSKE